MGQLKHASGDSNSTSTPSQCLTARPAWAISNMQCAMTPGNDRYNRRRDCTDGGGSSRWIAPNRFCRCAKAFPRSRILNTGTPYQEPGADFYARGITRLTAGMPGAGSC